MGKSIFLILLSFLLGGCVTTAGRVLFEVPDKPKLERKYLFYMHGIKLEGLGPDHKRAKAYHKILDELVNNGFHVFSEHREPVVIVSYAKVVAAQVNDLLRKGVPAKNITVSGFSKGSLIAQTVSTILQNPRINFVLLAGCTNLYKIDHSKMRGKILSIIDKDDLRFFSCSKKINARTAGIIFKEKSISSGRGHRVFRLSHKKYMTLWVDPLLAWVM